MGCVTPWGQWSGFESGLALTPCRQSQRKATSSRNEGGVSQSIQRGDGLLRNSSRFVEAAHKASIVATDPAGGYSDCATPCHEHPATLQRRTQIQLFHNTPLGRWKK
eukprot:5833015-Prymnesium_polylepis.1